MPKCACGCGRECNKTYVSGHNFRGHHQSQEVKDRISKVHKGKHKTEEEKEYISKRTKLAMASPEIRQKISNAKKDKPNYKLRGTKKSEETKNKISEGTRLGMQKQSIRQKISNAKIGKPSKLKGITISEELRQKISKNTKIAMLKPSVRRKISESNKRRFSISNYLSRLEDKNLEFKSTLCWDIDNNMKNRVMEDMVVKTIAAFNNTDGGTLLIGIDDNKNILGLKFDFIQGNLKNKDKFLLHLNDIICGRLNCDRGSLKQLINIKFVSQLNKDVCVIDIKKGTKPIYTMDKSFYIRYDNKTIKLEIDEIYNYIKDRFEQQVN